MQIEVSDRVYAMLEEYQSAMNYGSVNDCINRELETALVQWKIERHGIVREYEVGMKNIYKREDKLKRNLHDALNRHSAYSIITE